MKIGIIGAGRAGTAVGGFLKQKGLEITGFYSRNLNSAVESAVLVDTKAFLDLHDLFTQSDVLIIAVSDDVIRKTAIALAKWDLGDKILCHLSGFLPAACLHTDSNDNVTNLALHPLASFSSKQPPENVTFSLEGTGPRADQLQTEFKQHDISVCPMSLEQLSVYHLAISFMNSFATTMAGIGRELLRSVGILDCTPFADMLVETYRRAITAPNIRDVLTGPVATEDIGLLKRQLSALKCVSPDIAHLYVELSIKSMSYSRLDNYAKVRIHNTLLPNT